MKHNAFTALSMAAALVVAGSAKATEFSMNFESGTALPTTEGTWTVPTGDASEVIDTPSGAPAACQTQVLSLDTGDDELNYAPTSAVVSVLSMDVCFVGAEEDPSIDGFTGQTMVYLNSTNNTLYAYVGNSWITLTNGIVDGSWHSLGMTFDYTAKTVDFSVDGHTVATDISMGNNSSFQKVTSVGFKGTGMVDNFVGDKAGIPGYADDGTTGEQGDNAASYENGVVTGSFATDDLKFIRVYNGNNYVTLRYTGSQAITLPANFGTPTKVVAYYGDDVSATTGITPEATDVAVDNGTVTVSFAAKSGVYYWLKDVSDGVSGNISLDGTETAIAPNAEGVITLTFDADSHAWGVKKFQLVVDDNPPPAAAGN